jgi:O-antigen ligase
MSLNKKSILRKSVLIGLFLLMTIYHAIFVFATHGVYCYSDWLTPIFPCFWSSAILEMVIWGIILIVLLMDLFQGHDFKDFFQTLKSTWPVFLFVLLAAISSIWSIAYKITIYQAGVLLMSTTLAIYTGRTLGNKRLLDMLVWFFAVLVILNLGCVILIPQIGIKPPQYAWSGIFWHKNYLGCFVALGISVFVLKLLDWRNIDLLYKIVCLSMLPISVISLVKAESATGILTGIILMGLCLIIAAWLRFEKYLKPLHYYIVLVLFIAVVIMIPINLEWISGLLGRNASLTGRIPLWRYLINHVILKRPVLGYGYGVVWSFGGFREGMADILGWSTPCVIGDNGFVDIVLHLGFLGLSILIGLMVIGFVRSIKYFLKLRTLNSAFPLVLLVFTLVANITHSLMLESESFVWSMVIASQVAVGAAKHQA